MKKDEFEDIFKDSFENFEAEVSPSVWKNVQTALKGAGIGLLGKAIINKIGTNTFIAIVSSAAAIVSTVVVMNWGGKTEPKSVANNVVAPKTVVDKPQPAKVEEIKEFLTDKPAVKSDYTAAKETPKSEENKAKEPANLLVIKKDQMNEVINEYASEQVASISASPVGGTVPLIVNLNNAGTGKTNKWSFGDGKKESGLNPVHVYDTPGLYTVVLTSTSADGKTVSDSLKIEVTGNSSLATNEIARSFSPNGDNDNDVFRLEFDNMTEVSAVIFDEDKKIVYTQTEFKGKWNGNDLHGKPSKAGEYYYFIKALGKDGKKYEKKGQIKLIR